jgi:hypothetical protein
MWGTSPFLSETSDAFPIHFQGKNWNTINLR